MKIRSYIFLFSGLIALLLAAGLATTALAAPAAPIDIPLPSRMGQPSLPGSGVMSGQMVLKRSMATPLFRIAPTGGYMHTPHPKKF